MARNRKLISGYPTGSAPAVQGKARRYIPLIPGSGQNSLGYWNRLVLRPEKNGYNTSFKTDPRFPVFDEEGNVVAVPADHRTNASRRGGDRVKPNSGGPIQRKIL
jgi:hypothetical protein